MVAVSGSASLLRTLLSLKTKFPEMPVAALAGVPTDQIPALAKLLDFVSIELADIPLRPPVGGGVQGPGPSHINPTPNLTTLTLLLEFLRTQLPELPPSRTQQVPAPVEVADVQRAAAPNPAPPAPVPVITGPAPTQSSEYQGAAAATFASGPGNPPAGTPPAASSNGSPETFTNVSVAASTNVSGQTPAGGGNVTTGAPGETPESAGLGSPSGVEGGLGSGVGLPTGGEGPAGGDAGPNPNGGTTGDDPNPGAAE